MTPIKIVYVTGCLGFIGSYVTRLCLERGWYVYGVDKITYAANESLLIEFESYPNFKFHRCDINDLQFLYDCDYIINTAAETHVGNSISKSDEFVQSNIVGVHTLLQLLREHRGETGKKPILLHFSTDEVYGDISSGAHTESDLLKPSNPYSATKAAADMLIQAWHRTYGTPYIIVRPTNNYGIGQYVEKLIPKAVKFLSVDRKVPLHNHGTPIRNWLHAADTANAVLTIIDSGIVDDVFNISGGLELPNISVVSSIIKLVHGPDAAVNDYVDYSMHRNGQDVRYSLDDSKLKLLGWRPYKNFNDELIPIVQYYLANFIW